MLESSEETKEKPEAQAQIGTVEQETPRFGLAIALLEIGVGLLSEDLNFDFYFFILQKNNIK